MRPFPWIVAILFLLGSAGARDTMQPVTAGPFRVEVPRAWASSVIVEKVASRPLYSPGDWAALQKDPMMVLKPGYGTRPQHWAIRIPALYLSGAEWHEHYDPNQDETAPQILIHRSEEWAAILGHGQHSEEEAAATLRDLRQRLDALAEKDYSRANPAFGSSFGPLALQKRLSFHGGHGYRMLAEWTFEPDIVRRGRLHYVFLGLSDDNTCQIIATFPLDVPGLPDYEATGHLGYSLKDYDAFARRMTDYLQQASVWLEEHGDQFTPSLQQLDRMIESLSAESWK